MDKFILLDPKIDFVFKAIFGCAVHSRPLLSLINSILEAFGELPAREITVLNPVLNLDHVNDKGAILDIRAEAEWAGPLAGEVTRKQIDTEMQLLNQYNWPGRSVFYWSKLFCAQLEKGEDYRKLKQTISISLLGFKLFDRSRRYSLYEIRERQDHQPLSSLLQMYFVELPTCSSGTLNEERNLMLKKISEIEEPLPPRLAEWVQFFNAKTLEELDRLPKDNEAIQEAREMLIKLSQDPEAREISEMRRRAVMDYECNMQGAKEEGIKIGKEEGKAELLIGQSTAKYGPLPSWVEDKLKHASAEQIMKWSINLLQAETLEAWISSLYLDQF